MYEAIELKPNGMFVDIREWITAKLEKKRAIYESENLAGILLTVPRKGESVLHEQNVDLGDGRFAYVMLCNTANAKSLDQLLAARHGADRIEIVIPKSADQHGFGVTLHLDQDHSLEYTERKDGVHEGRIFPSVLSTKGYKAFIDRREVAFDNHLQACVYKQTADIINTVLLSMTGQPVPQITP
jgi:hypothetical protein